MLIRRIASILRLLARVLVVALSILSFFYPSGPEYEPEPSPIYEPPAPSVHGEIVYDESNVRVCSAIHALRLLRRDDPTRAPTPFTFLQLSPRTAPFFPPSLAYPGSSARLELQDLVQSAALELRRRQWTYYEHHGQTVKPDGAEMDGSVIDASYLVAQMLLDDAARAFYMHHLEPHKRFSERLKAEERFCGNLWRDMGWRGTKE